jgi:O-antigen/teichoic acid export membrane protein
MSVGVSLILIAAGAILAFAVTKEVEGIEISTVGWILMIVGVAGLLLSLLFWGDRGPWRRRTTYVEGDVPSRRRTTVVEDDDVPPGPPPP